MRILHILRSFAIVMAGVAGLVVTARAQMPDTTMWCVDGNVASLARVDGTLYLGGNFRNVAPFTGCAVPFSASTGQPLAGFPRVSGVVRVILADGVGGWFIGGRFDGIAGSPRRNLAHLLASGAVAPWAPDPDSEVLAIARLGNQLYVGGRFEHIGGAARFKIGAVHVTTGIATAFDPSPPMLGPNSWPSVTAIAATPSFVYVSGLFSSIGGGIRSKLAQLDPNTGQATSWVYNLPLKVPAICLVATGNSLFAGGAFDSSVGTPRGGIVEIDATTALHTSWAPDVNGPVYAMLLTPTSLFIAGAFDNVDGQLRSRIAQFDLATRAVTAFSPPAISGGQAFRVEAIALLGTTLFAGGPFGAVDGQMRQGLMALDATSGALLPWGPQANGATHAIAAIPGTVFAGGDFHSVGGAARNNLCAIDLATGQPTSWAPQTNGTVLELVVSGDDVFISGIFSQVNGTSRFHSARLDRSTGIESTTNTPLTGQQARLVVNGPWLYTTSAQRFDLVNGVLDSWAPPIAGGVLDMRFVGPSADLALATFAGVQTVTSSLPGSVLWSALTNGSANAITSIGNTLYTGGSFISIASTPRTRLASLDATTGAVGTWAPDANGAVNSLVADAFGQIYAGGAFSTIAGVARNGFAVLDGTTGAALPYDLHIDQGGTLQRQWLLGSDLYVTGSFMSVSGFAQPGFARVAPPPPLGVTPTVPAQVALAVRPSPARTQAELRWSQPREGSVSIDVYDALGRLVASPLHNAPKVAGGGSIVLATSGWRPGVYLAVLRTHGARVSRRLVVIE